MKADVAELCGEEQSHRDSERPEWQFASTLLEKEPRFHFSIGSILNVSGLFNPTKCFFMVRQMKVKYFCGKTAFGGFFWSWGGFFGQVLFFFSLPPAPWKIFHQLREIPNTQLVYRECHTWESTTDYAFKSKQRPQQ